MSVSVISDVMRQFPKDLSQHLGQMDQPVGASMRAPDAQIGADSFDPSQFVQPGNTPEPESPDTSRRTKPYPARPTAWQSVSRQPNNQRQQLLWMQAVSAPLASNMVREGVKAIAPELKGQVPELVEHVVKDEVEQHEQDEKQKRRNAYLSYGPYGAYYNQAQQSLPINPSLSGFAPAGRRLSLQA